MKPWEVAIHSSHYHADVGRQMRLAPRQPFATDRLRGLLAEPRPSSNRSKPLVLPSPDGLQFLLAIINELALKADAENDRRNKWHLYAKDLATAFIVAVEETNATRKTWYDNNGDLGRFMAGVIPYVTGEHPKPSAAAQQARAETKVKDWDTTLAKAKERFEELRTASIGSET